MYYNKEQLKDLKKQVDEKAAWFKDASFRDIEVNLTSNELIDKVHDLVQLALEYRTSQLDVDREDLVRVARLKEKLNIDFFTESRRIFSNACAVWVTFNVAPLLLRSMGSAKQ